MSKRNKRAPAEAQDVSPETQVIAEQAEPKPPLEPVPPTIGGAAVVDIELLRESPFNPRRTFGNMAELETSIRAHGLVQPITVRPKLLDDGTDHYEIVAGHRRFRACKNIGRTQIEVLIREMDDDAALEIQLIENVQRQDLHPLEEAEGYEQLRDRCRYTIEQLVERTGKSRASIYAALKLLALGKDARAAFFAGALNASVALHVARLAGNELQRRAIQGLMAEAKRTGETELSVRSARAYLRREFLIDLKDAPFKLDDAELCPKRGACTTCPFRTGNMVETLGEALGEESANLCTNSECFSEKCEAAWDVACKAHEEAGGKIMSKTEAAKVFNSSGFNVWIQDNEWRDLADHDYQHGSGNKTLKQLLKGADLEVWLARPPKNPGSFHQLAKRDAVEKLLRKRAPKESAAQAKARASERAAAQKDKAKRAARQRAMELLLGQVSAAVNSKLDGSAKAATEVWRAMAVSLTAHMYDDKRMEAILGQYSVVEEDPKGAKRGMDRTSRLRKQFDEWLKGAGPSALRGVCLEQMMLSAADNYRPLTQQMDGAFGALAKALGLDVAAAEQKAVKPEKAAEPKTAEGEEPKPEKSAKAKKPAKVKTPRRKA